MVSKNVGKKHRHFYRKKHEIFSTGRLEFLEKIGEKWGKVLRFSRTTVPTVGYKKGHKCLIHIAYGDVPYIVIGAKGMGRTQEVAESHCAWNLLSFFQEYLGESTVNEIRKYWDEAEEEIEEVVKVCRAIESLMNTERFRELRMVSVLDIDAPEADLARMLLEESRRIFRQRTSNSSTTLEGVKDTMSADVKDTISAEVKDATSPDVKDTMSAELPVLIRYCWKRHLSVRDAAREICNVEGEGSVSHETVAMWYKRFESGDLSLEDQPRSGLPNVDDGDL
ncbi:hypothetical protein KIN20_038421 [Parelaphostrongylus tenuis]|uniref:Mos1 transposase HTH domain-containing protein n=1 Tax=Parelaphostrongylus tenuis TaxID=148309 RepID=A0AAD5QQW2_PARTN|nr:hypothetical protein KIN20_038421 [Parelaphostrongylus tenuis]